MGQKTAGTVYISVDGMQMVVSGGAECPITDVTRETLVPGYFSEKDRVAYTKVDAIHTSDLDLTKLTQGTEMTVTTEFKNGKTYVLSGAYLVGEPASSGDDGKISLEFNGTKGVWQ